MLTSLQNPLVKEIRKLHQGKFRRQQGCFLLEGTHLVQEALAVGYHLSVACHTPAWQDRYPALAAALIQSAQRLEIVSEEVLQSLVTTVHPDGVVAVAPQRPPSEIPAIYGVGLVLETLQDPGNLGTIIRTATAAQVDGLWLSADSVAPDHPKVLRASAGQWFRLPMVVDTQLENTLQTWRSQGIQLVSTLPNASLDYWSVDFTRPTVILLGNEGAGLSATLQQYATTAVKIPMHPAVESLNVAISAALLLYEAQRQRRG
ncbi:rRNA methyltransferase [Leptolyngbya sp. BL0902]|uniref:TrmH family RNA methyltransferase n=1 Tax=Leptolyngbya sp. BL0902 TaxID=1115757 RepID=UPI0018E841C8|nr:RNA methyltransferase [Leptolyngbya sp. BL0902]QQE65760.1 rRNA methyltransferase [Leptolyngbya sp. BL0902]